MSVSLKTCGRIIIALADKMVSFLHIWIAELRSCQIRISTFSFFLRSYSLADTRKIQRKKGYHKFYCTTYSVHNFHIGEPAEPRGCALRPTKGLVIVDIDITTHQKS